MIELKPNRGTPYDQLVADRRVREPGPPPPHGTRSRYYWRPEPCRCQECRDANTAYYHARRWSS